MIGNMRPLREIAVVGDGEHVAAGLVLVGRHPLPEVARIVAAGRLAS